MPNNIAHSITGIAAGGGLGYAMAKDEAPEGRAKGALLGALGGLIGSAIADAIDPPTSYRHRGPGHSLLLGIGAGLLLFYAAGRLNGGERSLDQGCDEGRLSEERVSSVWPAFLRGLAAGHLSHLALDGLTPMGLPL